MAVQAKVEHLGQLERLKERTFNESVASGKASFTTALVKIIDTERKVLGLDREATADDNRLTAEDLLRELEPDYPDR